jgi:hypothetical protein
MLAAIGRPAGGNPILYSQGLLDSDCRGNLSFCLVPRTYLSPCEVKTVLVLLTAPVGPSHTADSQHSLAAVASRTRFTLSQNEGDDRTTAGCSCRCESADPGLRPQAEGEATVSLERV